MQHIGPSRLLEVADKDVRLTEVELDHIEKCRECVDVFAKQILQAALSRAKKKSEKKEVS